MKLSLKHAAGALTFAAVMMTGFVGAHAVDPDETCRHQPTACKKVRGTAIKSAQPAPVQTPTSTLNPAAAADIETGQLREKAMAKPDPNPVGAKATSAEPAKPQLR